MSSRRRSLTAAAVLALTAATAAVPLTASAHDGHRDGGDRHKALRVATYNLSLNRATAGELEADLSTGDDVQARTVAEVIQRADPDVVLLNEFDYDAAHASVDLFRENYLEVPQGGADPVRYRYAYV